MKPKICIPICASSAQQLLEYYAQASVWADLIEIRLDCLPEGELPFILARLPELIKSTDLPLIITRRICEEGGVSDFASIDAPSFWQNFDSGNAWCDLEADWLSPLLRSPIAKERIIASHHDFNATPDNLGSIYEGLRSTGARCLKIAVTARDIIDCLPIFRLLQRAEQENQPLIALAMGDSGLITRILGPAFGSWLTFASLTESSPTASGQIPCRQLKELYRLPQLTQSTPIYGLAGWPIGHSCSPHMHNTAFSHMGAPGVYIPLAVKDLSEFMPRMVRPETREIAWNWRGLSVTAPHKKAIMSYMDWVSPAARSIGAVNTIVFEGSKLHGYNTDTIGFIQPLKAVFGELQDSRCLILGGGGAARCALWALKQSRAKIAVSTRKSAQTEELAVEFGAEVVGWGGNFGAYDIVVNTTPLGTKGREIDQSPAYNSQLRGVKLAYDLVYNPTHTRFLHEAQTAGCKTLGGLDMLVNQAAAQFSLWTNCTAPVEVMKRAAELAIS